MRDRFDRTIDYIRFSITDRCNLRCQYCMPQGVPLGCHQDLLTFEEFLQVAQAAVELGVTRFKVTGGEPLVRRGCLDFLRRLKALPGVEQVTLTTNGVLLAPLVPALKEMGLDGVNISLDDPTPAGFRAITGFDLLPPVLEGLSASWRRASGPSSTACCSPAVRGGCPPWPPLPRASRWTCASSR